MRDVGTLLEALPYIREFHGRTVVIKYGGAAMNDPELREDFARDVVLLKYVGMNPIVVHGGGPEITALHGAAEPAGRVRRRPAGERRGDRRGGQDGARRQGQQGHRAAHQPPRAAGGRACAATTGCCSASTRWRARAAEDIGLVGRIDKVNIGVIEHIAEDYIPVIASIGADRNGRSHNVNADEAAAAVARALGAYKLMFLTDVPGWLSDPGDPDVGDLRDRRRRGRGGARPSRAAGCGRSCRRAWTPSTAASASRTSSTGGCRTRCCSSCSPTPARAPRSGPPLERAGQHLRALPGRVRVRLRAACSSTPRATSTSTSCPAWRSATPATATRTSWRRSRSRRARLMHVSNLYWNAPMMRLAERLVERSFGSSVFFCNSGAEANEAALKLVRKARPRGDDRRRSTAPSTAAPTARCRPRRRSPSRRRSRRWCRASGRSRPSRDAVRAAVDEQHRGGADRAGARASRACTRCPTSCCGRRARRATRRARRSCFDEVQTGMGRTGTLWALRAARASCRTR